MAQRRISHSAKLILIENPNKRFRVERNFYVKEPLVSVHMITYNHAPYIAQAIEGVLKQETNFPFELVIGEDCSTDGTRKIVFEYQKKYPLIIRVVTSEKNVGSHENAHRTEKACRGKYIAYCEGDDFWHHPGKLQKQADYLENQPECGLVYSSYNVHHVRSKKTIEDFIKHRKWEMPKNPSISDFLEGSDAMAFGVLTCTVMVRRFLPEQIRESDPYLHRSGHFLMGDTQLWAEMATRAHLHYIPDSLATHNITDDSATRGRDIRRSLRFAASGAELMLYLCDKYNLPQRIRSKHEANWCYSSLRLAFHAKNAELAHEARREKKRLTAKEWLLYCGARNPALNYVLRVVVLTLNLFRQQNSQWL